MSTAPPDVIILSDSDDDNELNCWDKDTHLAIRNSLGLGIKNEPGSARKKVKHGRCASMAIDLDNDDEVPFV